MDSIKRTESLKSDHLKQRSRNFFYKGPDGKHLKFKSLPHSLNSVTAKQPQRVYKGRGVAVFQYNSIYKKRAVATFGPQATVCQPLISSTFVTFWPNENLGPQEYRINPCYLKPSVLNLGLAHFHHKLLVFQMEFIK